MKQTVYTSLALSFLVPVFFADAYTFSRPLTVGSNGPDVYELQKFLNNNPLTQIADQGDGAPGFETSYFGQKTKNAVIKLQNMHASEILIPNGLTTGTGFVGLSTIAFLNKGQSGATSTVQTNTPNIPTVSPPPPQKVPEFVVSDTTVKADTVIYVGSQKDITDVDFYIDSELLWKKCSTQYNCRVHIDEKTKAGTYKLKTENESWGSFDLEVLDSSEARPRTNIKSINLKGENLITGSYFSPKMKVYTGFGVFETETRNNSFILEFPAEYVRNASSTSEGLFMLENDNGLRSATMKIRYEI